MGFCNYFLKEGDWIKGETMRVLNIKPGKDFPQGKRKAQEGNAGVLQINNQPDRFYFMGYL